MSAKNGKYINCDYCGKPRYYPKSRINNHKRHYCCKKCYYEDKKNTTIPWNKGLTKETDKRVERAAEITKETHWSKKGYTSWQLGLTRETDERIDKLIQKREDNGNNPVNRQEVRDKISKTLKGRYAGDKNPRFGISPPHAKQGYRKDIRMFVRSSWEANMCRLFNYLNINFEYEKHRFNLGDHTYLPDFYLPEQELFIEVKGRQIFTNTDKFYEFEEKYPDKNTCLIDNDVYKKINEKYRNIIPNWETPSKPYISDKKHPAQTTQDTIHF